MAELVDEEREDLVINRTLPYLSYTQVNKYLTCPEQYRLYYLEKLRRKVPKANLVFGQVFHQALAHWFRDKGDGVKLFQNLWESVRSVELTYSQKESWKKLRSAGQNLLEKFLTEEVSRLVNVSAVEKVFELTITNFVLPVVGVIDLVAEIERKVTVVDFKSASSSYAVHEVALSDQLTAYQLAVPEAEQVAFCTFIKTKEPKIEWHFGKRTGVQLAGYLSKVNYVCQEIGQGSFYKRSGSWCSWCDYLPVCMGDQKKIEETLVKIAP